MGPPDEHESAARLRERVESAPSPVQYDVSAGLERHRRLVAQGAALPSWEDEVPASVLASRWNQFRPWVWGACLGLCAAGSVAWLASSTLVVGTSYESRPSVSAALEQAQTPTVTPLETGREGKSQARRKAVTDNSVAAAGERPTAEPSSPALPGVPQVTALPASVPDLPTPPPEATKPDAPSARAAAELPAPRVNHSATRPSAKPAKSAAGQAVDGTPSGKSVSGQTPEDGEEIRQLVRAEELLTPDPLRALQLVRDGNARFRHGYLRQERRYLEVMALFALGRLGEAHAHAQWFLNEYPSGPYREKVELAVLRYPLR